ncbi:solute carrier family 2, facilitated glucose transporter member 7-like [Alosa alosa]|nr:solute carrier family 2, facilitated glucose transporter member 7-like [Alosa alosa]XP_048111692.1 solute carrier family 2, facilitated glucose transporter member 7-like [Alosa alosa]
MGTGDMWPYLLAVSGLPAILQFVSMLFFPEAPCYLYIDKGDEDGCKKALQWLCREDDVNLKIELEDMRKERESAQVTQTKTMLDGLRDRSVRWQLMAMLIPSSGPNFCGINAVSGRTLSITPVLKVLKGGVLKSIDI